MKTYLKVRWIHNFSNDPILLNGKLDENCCEVRKVKIFPNHSIDFTGADSNAKDIPRGKVPVPSFEEIATNSEFEQRKYQLILN